MRCLAYVNVRTMYNLCHVCLYAQVWSDGSVYMSFTYGSLTSSHLSLWLCVHRIALLMHKVMYVLYTSAWLHMPVTYICGAKHLATSTCALCTVYVPHGYICICIFNRSLNCESEVTILVSWRHVVYTIMCTVHSLLHSQMYRTLPCSSNGLC